MTCAGHPDELARLRHRLGAHLEANGLDTNTSGIATLIAAELLTNAFEAGPPGSPIELMARLDDTVVTIEVTNRVDARRSPAVESRVALGMPDASAERGRGLPLVAALATRLSVTVESGTVRVRADLLTGRPPDS